MGSYNYFGDISWEWGSSPASYDYGDDYYRPEVEEPEECEEHDGVELVYSTICRRCGVDVRRYGGRWIKVED